ncbi:hypothetical protein ACIBK9_38010 [Nonomuraea sp. NPDC050227]|uniref:hypothetical protein n=1 Tax=Nonomuraea sp. NPDC050227 TaxID=3364360 RepID=UPI00378816E6
MNSSATHKSSPMARRLRVWASTVALSTSLAPILATGAAFAATGPAATDPFQGIDWAPVVERALHCPKPGPKDKWYVVRARVAAVGDLTRDGRPDTVVTSSCPSPTAGNPVLAFVYDGASRRSAPRLIGTLGKNRYFKTQTVAIQNGEVRLSGKVVSDKAPRCCPDLLVRQTYKWTGKAFKRTSEKLAKLS